MTIVHQISLQTCSKPPFFHPRYHILVHKCFFLVFSWQLWKIKICRYFSISGIWGKFCTDLRESLGPWGIRWKSFPHWFLHGIDLIPVLNLWKMLRNTAYKCKRACDFFSDSEIPQNRKISRNLYLPKPTEKF